MNNLAVVGSPISHSKSPLLHLAAYAELGLDWSYSREEIQVGHLADFVESLPVSWRGLSVTMPLKSDAFMISSSHDAHAKYTGAVNTLSFGYESGRRTIRGYNTDVFGITASVTAAGGAESGHAALIGGGATALSSLVALDQLGFRSVTVALRDPAKAQTLHLLARRLGIILNVIDLREIHLSEVADLAISTVPGSAAVSLDRLQRREGALLLDVAYDVWPSPRAVNWNAHGGRSISGLSMLAFQAIKQVRIFTSESPDEALFLEKSVSQAMFASVGLSPLGL